MPLILISGYPSSGKTQRSLQLVDFFNSKISTSSDPRISRLKVQHLSDQSLNLARSTYDAARQEKNTRAAFSSAIKRHLSPSTILIADSLNYIKGYRYQLYCEAKAVSTASVVVHIGTPVQKCREYNTRAVEAGTGGWETEQFENLVFRYEEPNGMTRWDSPLFTVAWDDEAPPGEAIWGALFDETGKARVVKPNAATVIKKEAETGYLEFLDRVTSEIVGACVGWQNEHRGESGGEVTVDGGKTVRLPVAQEVSGPQLQRLRRQFIGLNRGHEITKARIGEVFVDYLNDAFGN